MYTGNNRFSGNDRYSGLQGPDRFFRYIRRYLPLLETNILLISSSKLVVLGTKMVGFPSSYVLVQ